MLRTSTSTLFSSNRIRDCLQKKLVIVSLCHLSSMETWAIGIDSLFLLFFNLVYTLNLGVSVSLIWRKCTILSGEIVLVSSILRGDWVSELLSEVAMSRVTGLWFWDFFKESSDHAMLFLLMAEGSGVPECCIVVVLIYLLVLMILLLERVQESSWGVWWLDRLLLLPEDIAMAEVDMKSFDPQEFRLFQQIGSCSQHFNEDFIFSEESMNVETPQILDKGLMEYGCLHYRRRCSIRAPCCNEIFDCRHCHNEVKNNINVDQKHRHDMPRHEVKQVICSLCGTEQEVQQVCINCGVCMGKYFCETCKLFDDDDSAYLFCLTSKKQYHCDGCGICRIGGPENFFHCYKCGCCYSNLLKNSHPCVEGAMHHDCPVCFEFLFESRDDVTVLPCGHTIHKSCLKEMRDHYQYACPLCSKSVCDMSKVWEKFDMEIAATPMPEPYLNKMVWILCNDCGKSSEVQFHVVAQKCLNCKSYNTRQTRS
ncbi:hypothetical protein POTOM_024151 [Populus tomentosa]|uniref:Uncharacterized protein n=1 Tax=Populus tomentosa TaxID=118781 RepID=A0A8X8CR79_POPTO|nr:hypothetical protein POTOM_024151 [Populus tomentosa]